MWTYEQSTGKLSNSIAGIVYEVYGYAGRGECKNNPALENVKGKGPLPKGTYTILPPRDSQTVGKYAMPLLPDPHNNMYGRNSFYIHGDSAEHPGEASHGCIVTGFDQRHILWLTGDHVLQVVQ